MRSRWAGFSLVAALAVGGLWCGAGISASEKAEKQGGERPKAAANAEGLNQVRTAFDLIRYGRKNRVPEALLVAARMLAASNLHEAKAEKGTTVEKVEKFDARKEAEALIEEALKMSEAPAVKALADATRTAVRTRERGPLTGPRNFGPVFLGPKQSQTITLALRGGEQTTAFVQSMDGVDMDLKVVGALTGATYGEDRGGSPNATVSFFMNAPGLIHFQVSNYSGNQGGRFILLVN